MVVEINKNVSDRTCLKSEHEPVIQTNRHAIKNSTPNFDEIVTEKREDVELEKALPVPVVKRTSIDDSDKNCGIPRAWCCLTSRRTS